MLAPSVGLLKVWPLPQAITAGITLFCIASGIFLTFLARRDNRFYFNPAVLFFILLSAILALSVWWNAYTLEASWRWYLVSFIACLVWLAASCEQKARDSAEFHRTLSTWLWLGCLVYAGLSLLQYYGVLNRLFAWAPPGGARLEGVWGQPNLTSTMAWLGVLASAVVFSPGKRRGWFYGSLLVFGWVLACAASRMSWLMALGLLALVGVSGMARYRAVDAQSARRVLLRATLATVCLLVVVPFINEPIRGALSSVGWLADGGVVALADREAFQDSARLTEFSKLRPYLAESSFTEMVLGVGPGNYPAFSYRADMGLPPEGLVAGTWLHSHNLYTMMLVEFGVVGLLLVLGFTGVLAVTALRQPIDLPRLFSIGGLGLLFIHSNLEFPLWNLWFLALACLLMVNLFSVRWIEGDSPWLKPLLGTGVAFMMVALLVNVGSQYVRMTEVAMKPDKSPEDLQNLSFLANDSLMGPYAILRKYRDFPPEASNLDWQLREVRRMKAWQPRDLVILREFSLLVLQGDIEQACEVARASAYRYPYSAPIMLDHSVLANRLSVSDIGQLADCIEQGLEPRGETLATMQKKNEQKLRRGSL